MHHFEDRVDGLRTDAGTSTELFARRMHDCGWSSEMGQELPGSGRPYAWQAFEEERRSSRTVLWLPPSKGDLVTEAF